MNDCRHTVLCVDDDENIRHSLKRLLRKEGYQLLMAQSGAEGLKLVAENRIHLVVSDQRMPEMNGTELLRRIKDDYPDIIRIVLTGYTDVDSITKSVNKGHIYKFILKPWNDENLKLEIRQGLEQYDLVQSNRMLHEKFIEQNKELKKINDNLEDLVKKRTKEIEIQNQALELSRAVLDDLPLPVIGISREMLIVMLNRKAQTLSGDNGSMNLGDRFSDYFSYEVEEKICNVFVTTNNDCVKSFKFAGASYNLDIIPLSGMFRGMGVVLMLNPDRI